MPQTRLFFMLEPTGKTTPPNKEERMENEAEVAQLFKWAVAWLDTGDIYYRDRIKNEVEIAFDNEPEFVTLCKKHFIEFPEDIFYRYHFEDSVQEWVETHRP